MSLDGRSYDMDDSRFIYALRIELDGLLLNEPYFEANSLPLKGVLSKLKNSEYFGKHSYLVYSIVLILKVNILFTINIHYK